MKDTLYYIILAIDFFVILFASSLIYVVVFPEAKSPSYIWLIGTFLIFSATTPCVKKLFKKIGNEDTYICDLIALSCIVQAGEKPK